MKIIIHRGTNQIGGSCVAISSDHAKIIIDIGLPLDSVGKSKEDATTMSHNAKIQAQEWIDGVDAVFISHYHGDHMGLIDAISTDIPVYMSAPAIRAYVLPQVLFSSVKERKLVPFHKKVTIGDIEITPFQVDHSAYGAQAFLISDGNKSVLYSGDLRMHGLSGKISHLPQNVDYLMIEGTNIDRQYSSGLWSETDVRERFEESFRNEQGIHYV